MGLFDRFKKNDDKKDKKEVIPDDPEIEEDQLLLKKIATTDKDLSLIHISEPTRPY